MSHTVKSRETEQQTPDGGQRRNFSEPQPPGSVPRSSCAETVFTSGRLMDELEEEGGGASRTMEVRPQN